MALEAGRKYTAASCYDGDKRFVCKCTDQIVMPQEEPMT
jgi:hypothetical protein